MGEDRNTPLERRGHTRRAKRRRGRREECIERRVSLSFETEGERERGRRRRRRGGEDDPRAVVGSGRVGLILRGVGQPRGGRRVAGGWLADVIVAASSAAWANRDAHSSQVHRSVDRGRVRPRVMTSEGM